MPLKITDEQDLVRQSQAYVRTELPELDPSTEKANFITGLVVAVAKMVSHFLLALKDFADRQVHPQTATGSALFHGWWTALTGLQRAPITVATGRVILPGANGVIIPSGTRFNFANIDYVTDKSVTVLDHSIRASSLTYSNGVAIYGTSEPHFFASGLTVSIGGAEDNAYNGDFIINVTAENEFTYEPTAAPNSAAGTDVVATSVYALLFVSSETSGPVGNLDGGSVLIESAIDDVDSEALVTYGGIAGGAGLEDPEDFRERVIAALSSTLGVFTAEEIRDFVKNIPGVTRVYIRKAQLNPENGWPGEGQTKIIFMRDNDANPIPSAQEVETIKNAIINSLMPTHMIENNLIVTGPSPKNIDIHIADLMPNTGSMQLAVRNHLEQFFQELDFISADLPKIPSKNLELMDLLCAIKSTIDLETGEKLESFKLNTPSTDTTLGPDETPLLGKIIFL